MTVAKGCDEKETPRAEKGWTAAEGGDSDPRLNVFALVVAYSP